MSKYFLDPGFDEGIRVTDDYPRYVPRKAMAYYVQYLDWSGEWRDYTASESTYADALLSKRDCASKFPRMSFRVKAH